MHLFQRDNSPFWYYEFELNGRTHRKSTRKTSKVEAMKVAVTAHKQASEDRATAHLKRWTMREAADNWLSTSAAELSDWRHNESRVRKLFGYRLDRETEEEKKERAGLPEDLMVHELTRGHIADLKDARVREGNALSTFNREIALVQSILTYCSDRTVLMPADFQVKGLKTREKKTKLRWFTVDEYREILRQLHLRLERTRNPLVIDQIHLTQFLVNTGCRYEEGASALWEVVNFDTSSIHIYRRKVGNEGVLPLSAELRGVLEHRKTLCAGRRYIFPGGTRNAWFKEDTHRGHATKGIQAAIDAAGCNGPDKVKRFGRATPHTFRDTFASWFVQNGGALYDLQHLLGHSDPQMTQKYAHLVPGNAAKKAAEILDRVNLHRVEALSV